jgi:MATE family multidrug resistance protein
MSCSPRFAAPHGIRMFIEMLVWGWFTIAVARLGTSALAANNIVINWNLLTFLPMMGFAQAVSIAAGQAQGAGDIGAVRRIARSGTHIMLLYALIIGVAILVFDDALIAAFLEKDAHDAQRISALARSLLIIAALWGIGDAINLTYTNVLNGVGDTRWTLVANIIMGVFVLVVPSIVVLYLNDIGKMYAEPVVVLWSITLAFITAIASITYRRFAGSRWESHSVR